MKGSGLSHEQFMAQYYAAKDGTDSAVVEKPPVTQRPMFESMLRKELKKPSPFPKTFGSSESLVYQSRMSVCDADRYQIENRTQYERCMVRKPFELRSDDETGEVRMYDPLDALRARPATPPSAGSRRASRRSSRGSSRSSRPVSVMDVLPPEEEALGFLLERAQDADDEAAEEVPSEDEGPAPARTPEPAAEEVPEPAASPTPRRLAPLAAPQSEPPPQPRTPPPAVVASAAAATQPVPRKGARRRRRLVKKKLLRRRPAAAAGAAGPGAVRSMFPQRRQPQAPRQKKKPVRQRLMARYVPTFLRRSKVTRRRKQGKNFQPFGHMAARLQAREAQRKKLMRQAKQRAVREAKARRRREAERRQREWQRWYQLNEKRKARKRQRVREMFLRRQRRMQARAWARQQRHEEHPPAFRATCPPDVHWAPVDGSPQNSPLRSPTKNARTRAMAGRDRVVKPVGLRARAAAAAAAAARAPMRRFFKRR